MLQISGDDEDVTDSAWWVLSQVCKQIEKASLLAEDGTTNGEHGVDATDGGGFARAVSGGAADAFACLCRQVDNIREGAECIRGVRERGCIESARGAVHAVLRSWEREGSEWENHVTRGEVDRSLLCLERCLRDLQASSE